MSKKTILTLGALAILVTSVSLAAGKGKLFPDWSKPVKGTWDLPAADLGIKPSNSQPWTVTTVTSSIEGKTLKGKPVTVVGEIVDLSCYLQVGKHGEKHKECGQKCARNGQPLGLLARDGSLYMLIDEEHDPRRDGLTAFRQAAIDNMANIVRVHGTFSEVEKQKAIFVQGYLKK